MSFVCDYHFFSWFNGGLVFYTEKSEKGLTLKFYNIALKWAIVTSRWHPLNITNRCTVKQFVSAKRRRPLVYGKNPYYEIDDEQMFLLLREAGRSTTTDKSVFVVLRFEEGAVFR